MRVLTPVDCSKQMQQPPGRFCRKWWHAQCVEGGQKIAIIPLHYSCTAADYLTRGVNAYMLMFTMMMTSPADTTDDDDVVIVTKIRRRHRC